MSTELALPDPGNVARWAAVLIPAAQLAERIAGTEFVPAAMRGKPDVVVAAIMYGDEIGIGPMQALASIHVVEGRPAPSAELMRAMILRAGHTFTVHDLTGSRARVSGLRAGAPESERAYVEWTLDMARAAGLLHKQNWSRYPRAMLLARATGDLARMLFPDVVKGLGYVAEDVTPDELETWAAVAPVGEDPPPPRKAVQRRTRPRNAAPGSESPATPERPPDAAERPPVAPYVEPRPPAPTRVDSEDRPIPELAAVPDPEPGPVEPPADVGPPGRGDPADRPVVANTIGAAQLRAVHTKLGRSMGPVDRDDKLAMISGILGREVETTKTLTRAEGFRVLDFLAAVESGEATWDVEDGRYVVTDLREPPDPPPPESVT